MNKRKAKGIFCLEGDWEPDLRNRVTVDPLFQLLEHSNYPKIPYIRRDVGTVQEFEYYLKKWTLKRYIDYPILYFGFHGEPGLLQVGSSRKPITNLDWIEDKLAGKCNKCIIHFVSCGTLDIHGKRLNKFLRITQALAVCGYKEDADWMLSAAFEVILLSELQKNSLTRPGMKAVKQRVVGKARGLANDLAFRMIVAP